MSYKPQFDTGDLVVTQSKNIGIVEPSSQAEHAPGVGLIMHYRVKFGRRDRYGAIEHVWGEKLRRPKFREFIWFRNPNTGGWMFGKTRGWMAGIIHLFSLIIFSCGVHAGRAIGPAIRSRIRPDDHRADVVRNVDELHEEMGMIWRKIRRPIILWTLCTIAFCIPWWMVRTDDRTWQWWSIIATWTFSAVINKWWGKWK